RSALPMSQSGHDAPRTRTGAAPRVSARWPPPSGPGSAPRGEPLPVEGAAGGALGGTGGVEIGGDPAAVAGEARAEDQREVHLLVLLDHALLDHQLDLLGQAGPHLLQQRLADQRLDAGGTLTLAEDLRDRRGDRRVHGGAAALGEVDAALRHDAEP